MITRRDAVAGLAGAGILATLPARAQPHARPPLIAGTYADAGGKGLYYVPELAGGWHVGEAVTELQNVSFGLTHGGKRYLLDEIDKGRLRVTDRGGRILADVSSGGDAPCHVAIAPDGQTLAVANYVSGTVAVYPIASDGLPGAATIRQHDGHGPNADRQASPHAHWVGFSRDGRHLHSVDLGADAIFRYSLDGSMPGNAQVAWRAPPGWGPRHLAHHPRMPLAYVVTELSNMLVTLDAHPNGSFTTRASTSLLPAGFTGKSQAAHIAIDAAGRRLYASNRGDDSIAVFALDTNGNASAIQHIKSGGRWPRFFLLLEDIGLCLVANQRSGNIAVFRIGIDGTLTATDETLAVPAAVFLDRA